MTTPLLFQDLRMALACLYSLSPGITAAGQMDDSRKAHDFLMHLQSRNVRRKLNSIQQSDRDQQKKKSTTSPLADEVQGSTWLACLAVLCCAQAESAERLFAAQTLMHRLRRVKLSEAIDLEMEDPNKYLDAQLNVNLVQLATDYAQWMNQLHPLLGTLVTHFLADHAISDTTDEGQLKGELSMLTLAAITYLTACHSRNDASIQPLIVTLGNSMAATALRLRFTPRSVSSSTDNGNKATLTSAPLVTMVVHSLSAAVAASNVRNNNNDVLFQCTCLCLGVIPEALLSSGGGAMGRISIDPRCIQAAHEELRQPSTGVYLLWDALRQTNTDEELSRASLLITCQKWAKCLPLPQDFVEYTVPLAGKLLASSLEASKSAALSYLIVIFESGSWTCQYILTFSLGLSSEQLSTQPSNKKRQSSRSKRRQKERLDTTATDDLRVQAEAECRHRGEMACLTTRLVWEGLASAVRQSLAHSVYIGGEGPVGCICASANACLPHWISHSSSSEADAAMAVSVMELFQEICTHPDRAVRALSYEPLYTLNSVLIAAAEARCNQVTPQPPSEMERAVADHLYQCVMRLATSCTYPTDYFDYFDSDDDEEMEVERNETRDLIRAVCGCEGDIARGDTTVPMDVSISILDQIVRSCTQACNTGDSLPPETAVHALSALAKPINVLANAYTKGYRCEGILEILSLSVNSLGNVHRSTITAFGTAPVKELFPVSRLSNLATAAFAPAFSAMCKLHDSASDTDRILSKAADQTVAAAVHGAALSLVHIPELTAESTLDHTQYDIRGAMRGPGGEDHVGCLALSRLAFESDELAALMMRSNDSGPSPSLPLELCKLHEKLKSIENQRGPGVFHGSGVAPKSRRILCQTICHILLLANADGKDQEALAVLNNLFMSLVASIAELAATPAEVDAERMYRICEGVLDLASFSSSMICTLFDSSNDESSPSRQKFLHGVIQTCQLGYSRFPAHSLPDETALRWGRLRGALVSFLRTSACPDVPRTARDALVVLSKSECQTIAQQCAFGPSSTSPIFNESVISDSSIPSGIFVRLLGEIVEGQEQAFIAKNCVSALQELRPVVLETLLIECPEPAISSFVDPRPTLCEAWYLSLSDVISSFASESRRACSDPATKTLLADSCCTAMCLLLYETIRKDGNEISNNVGMSLDGPQTRAMLAFLESYFLLGPDMLRTLAVSLRYRFDVDIENLDDSADDEVSHGVAIVGACLFRAASGGLPPWAIEAIPSLYAALFVACGNDSDTFCRMLELSMCIRMGKASGFGVVQPGELLAGRYMEIAKESAKRTFIQKSREACTENNANGWRKFKVLLKQACGGKKKSSLSLKPSYTTWDVERI